MLRLKNRQQAPVGGFRLTIPELNFTGEEVWWSFTDCVNALWQRVQGNAGVTVRFPQLPNTYEEAMAYVDAMNAARMQRIRNAAFYVLDDPGPAPSFPRPLSAKPVNAAAGARRMMTGENILQDWLGAGGKPVPAEQAEARARVCSACPLNQKGNWTRFFTVPASFLIQRTIELKHRLKLETPQDTELGVCSACSCPLKLKVHTPITHIASYLKPDQIEGLAGLCWIRQELHLPAATGYPTP